MEVTAAAGDTCVNRWDGKQMTVATPDWKLGRHVFGVAALASWPDHGTLALARQQGRASTALHCLRRLAAALILGIGA